MKDKFKPAFPFTPERPWDNESASGYLGLTKHEYFAAIAMQGMLANPNGAMTEGGFRAFSPDTISDLALKHADAMLDKLTAEPDGTNT